jgi:hypothetical protein
MLFLFLMMLLFTNPRPGRAGYYLGVEQDGKAIEEGFKLMHKNKEKIVVAIKKLSDTKAKCSLSLVLLLYEETSHFI